jgi:hypothetical protein
MRPLLPSSWLIRTDTSFSQYSSLDGYALRLQRCEPQCLLCEIDVKSNPRNLGIGKPLVGPYIAQAGTAAAFEVWVLTGQWSGRHWQCMQPAVWVERTMTTGC